MGRSLHRLAMFVALVAMAATTLILAASLTGTTADAQSVVAPRLSISEPSLPADGPLVVDVTLEPGSSMIAALTASLEYDPNEVAVVACSAGLTGVCNDLGDEVAFALFSITGITEDTGVLTVEFDRLRDVDETALELNVMTAVDAIGTEIPDLEIVNSVLSFLEATGALTGEVTAFATGESLHGIEVCVAGEGVGPICALTTGLGTFRFDGLPAGDYALSIADPAGSYAAATAEASVANDEVTAGVVVPLSVDVTDTDTTPDDVDQGNDDAGAPVDPDIEIDADVDTDEQPVSDSTPPVANDAGAPAPAEAGSISGVVTDSTGLAIFGVQVCVDQPLIGSAGCAYTSGDGSFSFGDLGAGNYVISVTDPAQRFNDLPNARYVGITTGSGVGGLELTLSAR